MCVTFNAKRAYQTIINADRQMLHIYKGGSSFI